MTNKKAAKKTEKKATKKLDKNTAKKLATKKSPKKVTRIDDSDPVEMAPPVQEQSDMVKTEIIIENGIVIVNPIYNPFDENK
jgi:hypothetical protein